MVPACGSTVLLASLRPRPPSPSSSAPAPTSHFPPRSLRGWQGDSRDSANPHARARFSEEAASSLLSAVSERGRERGKSRGGRGRRGRAPEGERERAGERRGALLIETGGDRNTCENSHYPQQLRNSLSTEAATQTIKTQGSKSAITRPHARFVQTKLTEPRFWRCVRLCE